MYVCYLHSPRAGILVDRVVRSFSDRQFKVGTTEQERHASSPAVQDCAIYRILFYSLVLVFKS